MKFNLIGWPNFTFMREREGANKAVGQRQQKLYLVEIQQCTCATNTKHSLKEIQSCTCNKYETTSEENLTMRARQKKKEHLQLNKKWWPQSCIWQHCLTLWSSLLAFLVINRSSSWLLQTSPSSWWYNDDIEGGHLEVSVHAKVLRHQAIVDSVTEKTANVHSDKKNLRGF